MIDKRKTGNVPLIRLVYDAIGEGISLSDDELRRKIDASWKAVVKECSIESPSGKLPRTLLGAQLERFTTPGLNHGLDVPASEVSDAMDTVNWSSLVTILHTLDDMYEITYCPVLVPICQVLLAYDLSEAEAYDVLRLIWKHRSYYLESTSALKGAALRQVTDDVLTVMYPKTLARAHAMGEFEERFLVPALDCFFVGLLPTEFVMKSFFTFVGGGTKALVKITKGIMRISKRRLKALPAGTKAAQWYAQQKHFIATEVSYSRFEEAVHSRHRKRLWRNMPKRSKLSRLVQASFREEERKYDNDYSPDFHTVATNNLESVRPLELQNYVCVRENKNALVSIPTEGMLLHGAAARQSLAAWVPVRFQHRRLELLFSSDEHGSDMETLFGKCEGSHPTLVMVETLAGAVFGGFASTAWGSGTTKRVLGTPECFLFRLTPELAKYGASPEQPENAIYMAVTETFFAMGASTESSGGFGLLISSDLANGSSATCNLFENPPLQLVGKDDEAGSSENRSGIASDTSFVISKVEVYALN